ncbi:cytidyltransferase [Candidatus Pacearchaeota archaeon]|nr:cytidyltransferase [Candidatus Pacearchaeota archaeon]|tara:strand:- start:6266 stop:6694 length:429 start_codon:yes stop_codon:yes gene_type:complete
MKEKVVAISGYFDPIHVGHLELIEKAKSLGDKLVVIVNNTEQAINKKGFEFMPFHERLKIVKAIKGVDSVFPSIDTDISVCKALAAIKPNVFANGGGRHQGEVPETALCKELNIEMVDGLGEKIQSSSDLAKKAEESKENSS